MKFQLRDYQRDAARRLLTDLAEALPGVARGRKSSFALSALTGAGKTVIATAVIEAVLYGSQDLDTDPIEDVAFLWVTDNDSLNKQTRDRMLQASDVIQVNQLNVIDRGFDQERLAPGKVYFLNTQKLGKSTTYVKTGDGRQYSLWDTVANTVKDGRTKIVMVLDEAHIGMKDEKDRKTKVRELIDGQTAKSAMPIVWGISATPKRFVDAMAGTAARTAFPVTEVDISLIQASGLVKDRINVANPGEKGTFDTTLLRQAVRDLAMMDKRWGVYTAANDLPTVRPAMIVQAKDKATEADLGLLFATIREEWRAATGKEAEDREFVNVFGDHAAIEVKGAGSDRNTIRYIEPERVQDDPFARFVLAKEAITTGWDCPRAEVLYSERPGQDVTHIAQLIGRIVRTPLAERVLADESLGAVHCYLPNFNQDNVKAVVDRIESGDTELVIEVSRETGSFYRIDALEARGVYELLAETPTRPAPAVTADPVRRARQLAILMDLTWADETARPEGWSGELTTYLNRKLDGLLAEHADEVATNRDDIETAEITKTIHHYIAGVPTETVTTTQRTDVHNIEDAYRSLKNRIKEGAVEDFRRHLAAKDQAKLDAEGYGDQVDMLDVRCTVAALLMVEGVVSRVNEAAGEWTRARFEEIRTRLAMVKDDRRADFEAIRQQTTEVEVSGILLPKTMSATTVDGQGETVPVWDGHIFADATGKFPAKLGGWELEVLNTEKDSPGFVAWYRNPSAASASALRIAYRDGAGEDARWRSVQPDFIFIHEDDAGRLRRSVVDPHGAHLADAVAKLKALVDYAGHHGDAFARIEALSKVDDQMLALDLTDPATRQAVAEWEDPKAEGLYRAHGHVYQVVQPATA
ncbi:DEAD/DEAH box helicase family protein (plasmid) [Citricoccus nitrophenolicus]